LGEVEVIQDELDFSMDEEVHIDGAEPPVEINSSETSPEELIEIPEIPADLQAENLEEGIPENESFKSIQTETEIIETIEETEEVFIDGAENGGVEINSAESSEAEEVELEEFSQNLVEEKELDV